ncbi:MAG: HAD family hydrolase, partial [Chloroflexi bacterium]|nr:HAD family hydrolase [Chloroflexota bacterium]
VYHHLTQQSITLPPFETFRDTGFGLMPSRWKQAITHERNLTVPSLLAETLAACDVSSLADDLLHEAARHYQQAIQDQATVIPDALHTLKAVKEAGYKIGLLSNTMFSGAAHLADLKLHGLDTFFDTMLFSGDVGKWKPNADPFLHVLEMMGIGGETAVYVGDDPASDVVGGQSAGLRTVYVQSNQRFHTPNGVVPDAKIDNLSELMPILYKWDID